MASEAQELRREFDETREELDEMAAEIASAEQIVADCARSDLQLGELRAMLERARVRHAELDTRERALRIKFGAVISGTTGRTH